MALKPKEHFHGSDLEKIEAVYGIKRRHYKFFCECKSTWCFVSVKRNFNESH